MNKIMGEGDDLGLQARMLLIALRNGRYRHGDFS